MFNTLGIKPDAFPTDAATLSRRLRKRISRGEVVALGLNLILIGVWLSLQKQFPPYDYNNYVNTAHGDFSHYYYAFWFLPVFSILNALPGPIGFILWSIINIAGVWLAARTFRGS